MTQKNKSTEFICSHCRTTNKIQHKRLLHLAKSPLCGSCSKPLLRAFAGPFEKLDPNAYIHPLDRDTLAALRKVPGTDTLLRTLIHHSFELAMRLHHEGSFLRVSNKQMPELYNQLVYAHGQLGMSQMPELYVFQNKNPNAYTFGVEKSFIAISTGALELLDSDEILCVLGHELGHIHSNHVLYKSASQVLSAAAGTLAQATLGLGNIVSYPIQVALSKWERASELSSDRASLLVVKNPSVVLSTLMKLSGGTNRYREQLNIEAFIDQAEGFEEIKEEGPLGKYISFFDTLFRSHPYPIWRAKELIGWMREGNFLQILDGVYSKQDGVVRVKDAVSQNVGPVAQGVRDIQDWYKRNFNVGNND